jgi:catechol-2,3-dioxygenase
MAPPIKFAHVVLRTSRYEEMIEWWTTALEAEVRYGNEFLSFMSYDDEHHRIAIAKMSSLTDVDRSVAGVEHVAFTWATLDDLLEHYLKLKGLGIEPFWSINHGMTLSAYYRDPDGNQVEFQVDVCSLDEADEFMQSDAFAANPIGVAANFDDIVARRKAGESVESLTAYVPGEMAFPSR